MISIVIGRGRKVHAAVEDGRGGLYTLCGAERRVNTGAPRLTRTDATVTCLSCAASSIVNGRPAADPVLAMAEAQERDLAHAEALEEDAAHDAAVAAALTPEEWLAADAMADRLVQGVPMHPDRDLAADLLTERETQQQNLAMDLARAKLHQSAVPPALPQRLRDRTRRPLVVPPGVQT